MDRKNASSKNKGEKLISSTKTKNNNQTTHTKSPHENRIKLGLTQTSISTK
jgi:hypothetical protein